jgi:hypothetical protein
MSISSKINALFRRPQKNASQEAAVSWSQTEKIWFDEADAIDRLSKISNSGIDNELGIGYLRSWISDGFFIVDDIVSGDDVDQILEDVRDIWSTEITRPLTINRVWVGGEFRPSIPHHEIVALPKSEREDIRRVSNYTLGDIHHASEPVNRVFQSPNIKKICETIFNAPAEPRNTLYFDKGSQQNIHQDTVVFHTFPRNAVVGVWIALEDISPDSGPLIYYPGSHKEPIWSEFPNYPQTNLRTVPANDLDKFKRYDNYLAGLKEKYKCKQALLKKGQALFWHGMLIHGGDKVNNEALSRQSLVIHVMQKDADKQSEMVGPFQW